MAGDIDGFFLGIGHLVLPFPEKHITPLRPVHPRKEAAFIER
jgi:hypothetical protein